MIDRIGRHGANEANIVNNSTNIGEQGADLGSIAAVFGEWKNRSQAEKFFSLKLRQLLTSSETLRHRFAIHLGQLGLRIVKLQMRGATCHG